jgi:enoyl-CoA hydratase/carnithine racemase
MNTLQVQLSQSVATITLDRGRSNAMNHEMVKELIAVFGQLEQDETVGGVIITGKHGFFSSGIDLLEAYEYNEEQSKQFWIDFLALQQVLVAFKKPLVASISGHSPAGGCVIAICCDYRVMAEGPFIIGLNEVPVGIIVPESIFHTYAFWIGQRLAYQYLLEGKLMKTEEALRIGLIDELADPDQLTKVAEKKVKQYLSYNSVTWSQSKKHLRNNLLTLVNRDQTDTLEKMLKQWWSPAVRKGLEIMIENLKAKSAAKSNEK